MKHMVNGKVVELVAGPDGSIQSDALRKAAGITDDRQLLIQLPDGSNRLINPGETIKVPPEQYFTDAPAHKRGSQTTNGHFHIDTRGGDRLDAK